MINFKFEVNRSKLKVRDKFFDDDALLGLVDGLLLNESWSIFIYDIKEFFNIFDFNSYLEKVDIKFDFYLSDDYFKDYIEDFKTIVFYFNSFKNIWEEGKFSKLKSTFLELFICRYLELKYLDCKIYRESRLFVGNFTSSMLIDVVGEVNGDFKVFECKFSHFGFKRNYLDNLYSITKVCPECKCFILTLDNYDDFYNHLFTLQENTSNDKFNNLVNSVNILSLESFEDGYFKIN